MSKDSDGGGMHKLFGLLASVIAVVGFVTGRESLGELVGITDTTTTTTTTTRGVQPIVQPPAGTESIPPDPAVVDLTGLWIGSLDQRDQFGVTFTWNVTLDLSQDGDLVSGRETIASTAGAYSVHQVVGAVDGTSVVLDDVGILESTPYMNWCQKRLVLVVTGRKLTGTWSSGTFGCEQFTGDVELDR